MAIRRPLIDVIDRGLDPRVAYNKLDKQGKLLVQTGMVAPVLVTQDMKEAVLVDEKKDVITENDSKFDKLEKKNEMKRAHKPVASDLKKTDKVLKPV